MVDLPVDGQAETAAQADIDARAAANAVDPVVPDETAPAEGDDGELSEPPPFIEDNKRLEMAERYTRERKDRKAAEGDDEPVAIVPENPKLTPDSPDDEIDEPGDNAAPVSDIPDDPIVTLTVLGQTVQMPFSEVRANASKNLAADDYLSQAKDILYATRQNAASQADAGNQSTDYDDGGIPGLDADGGNQIDSEKFVSAVDAIQTGSPEEGARLLAETVSDAVAAARGSNQDLDASVAVAIQNQRVQDETNRALKGLQDNFPEVMENPRTVGFVIEDTASGMLDELSHAGIPSDHIQQLKDHPRSEAVTRDYYLQARQLDAYSGLSAPADIANKAAKNVHDQFVVPRRGGKANEPDRAGRISVSPERASRKAGLTRQPRSASIRGSATKPALTVDQKRAAAFQELSQGRR